MNAYSQIEGQDTAIAASSPIKIQEQGFLPKGRPNSLVVVDASVKDADHLIADVGRNTKVLSIDGSEDGISAITDALAKYRNLESVHILSHGDSDQVQLGSTVLSSDTVANFEDQLQDWGASLTNDADILFYGCNIAGSNDGLDLIDSLSEYTGADIAASTDLTGSSELGGDWDLEYATGDIDTGIVPSVDARRAYKSVLNNFTHNFDNGALSRKFGIHSKTKHGVNVVDNPSGGGKVVRFDLRKGDPYVANKPRAELIPNLGQIRYGNTYTYEMRTFIPNDWKNDRSGETIMQWHGRPDKNLGENFRRPPVQLLVSGGKYQLKVHSDGDRVTDTSKRGTYKESRPWTGTVQKGKWVSWKFQIKWSFKSDGQLKMWQDGKQVLDFKGANAFNDKASPYLKFGIYKPDWKVRPQQSSTSRRVIFFDDIKFSQGATSAAASVAPQPAPVSNPTPKPSSGGITKIYQAESARRGGGISLRRGNGASWKYADFNRSKGEWLEWNVYVKSAGRYDLGWRYALDKGSNRPLRLSVNGQVKDNSVDFRNTGSWSRWRTSRKNNIFLKKGRNTIRVQTTGSSGANLDYLEVKPA